MPVTVLFNVLLFLINFLWLNHCIKNGWKPENLNLKHSFGKKGRERWNHLSWALLYHFPIEIGWRKIKSPILSSVHTKKSLWKKGREITCLELCPHSAFSSPAKPALCLTVLAPAFECIQEMYFDLIFQNYLFASVIFKS